MTTRLVTALAILFGFSSTVFASFSHRPRGTVHYKDQLVTIAGDDTSLAAELFRSLPIISESTSGFAPYALCTESSNTYSCTFTGQIPINRDFTWVEIAWQNGRDSYAAALQEILDSLPDANIYEDAEATAINVIVSVGDDKISCRTINERSYWFRDEGRDDRRRKCTRDDHRGCYEEIFPSVHICKVVGGLTLEDVE